MTMWTWFEDDTLWENLESILFSQFRSPESTVREAEQILGLVRPSPGAAVLDLCCGPGRHSLEFARRGFRVTGVDRTARYLATARAAASVAGLGWPVAAVAAGVEADAEQVEAWCAE